MSTPHDHIADARYITIILRLIVHPNDQLRGEITDVDGQQTTRFTTWSGLTRTLRDWLNEHYPGLIPSDQSNQSNQSDRTERS